MDHEEMQEQFMTVYDQYADAIFRFCQMKVSSRETAQDISQEVFTRYWQQLRLQKDIQNGRALLYSIARNLVIDWYRKKKEQSLDTLTLAGFDFGSDDHLTTIAKSEVKEVLAALQELDEPTREVITLRFVDGFLPKEIAELTGEPANTVSVRITRGLQKIRDHLHIHD